MSRKKVSTTVYLTQEQHQRLNRVHELTRVPVAEYVRRGVDLALAEVEPQVRAGEVPAFDWIRSEEAE